MNDILLKNIHKCGISLKSGIKYFVSIKNELNDNITFEKLPNMPIKIELDSQVQIKIESESDALLQNGPEAVVWNKSEVETDQQTELDFEEIKSEDIEVKITG